MHTGDSLKDDQRKGNPEPVEDPYAVLELQPGASPWEVEEAYRRIMAALDPSNPGVLALWSPEQLEAMREKVHRAYEQLLKRPKVEGKAKALKVQGLPEEVLEGIKAEKGGLGGEALREIRERLGLTLEDVSSCIKVTKGTLKALEEEDFDLLPPWIYIKGFLRAYARMLKIDADEVIRTFEEKYRIRTSSEGRNRRVS